jgi:hypothetical protein
MGFRDIDVQQFHQLFQGHRHDTVEPVEQPEYRARDKYDLEVHLLDSTKWPKDSRCGPLSLTWQVKLV